MHILLLNAGSSSLKCTLVEATQERILAQGSADWAGPKAHYRYVIADGPKFVEEVAWSGHADAVRRFVDDLIHVEPSVLPDRSSLSAVGHRVVHGGEFSTSVRITPEIRDRIMALKNLAPLHNPPSLETLAAAEEELPGVPQVAVFDTAFHANMLPEARNYPIPHRWSAEWGIRRFGFHGLSHSYCTQRAAEILGRPVTALRLVICHLGHGCSAAAVLGGRCIDTTMGFTPMEGLMMATRCGSIDPGILIHVQQRFGLTAEEIEKSLNRESGLLGVSGISADMRQVLAAARGGDRRAQLAIAIYVHRVRQAIGAATVTLGGIDALVFTAGVGENSAEIRASVCEGLGCLGLEVDDPANADCQTDADISASKSRGRVLVIAAREDLTMLKEVQRAMNSEIGWTNDLERAYGRE